MIKKLAFALLFSASLLQAQEEVKTNTSKVQIGDVLEIGTSKRMDYKHINFPRANFIIKRGGLANYKGLKGDRVVVTAIETNKDGSTKIKIKRKDGGRFFGSHTVVSADINNALAAGELLMN